MDKKIKLYILLAFIGAIFLLGASFFTDFKYSESNGLTYEQKKKDGEYLVHLLEEVYPFYEKERKEGNIGSKNQIVNAISKTKTDEEFYSALLNTIGNLKDGIVGINTMQLNGGELFLFDKKWGIDETNYVDKSNEGYKKWSEISEKLNKSRVFILPEIITEYFEGEYYVMSSKNPNIFPGDKITKIKGIAIEEYISKNFTVKSSNGYYKHYDSKRAKETIIGDLLQLENKDSKVNITVIGKDGAEKEIEVGADDPNKTWQFQGSNVDVVEEKDLEKNRDLLNTFENGKILALNFSMERMESNEEVKKEIYKAIDDSEYLILDTRGASTETSLFEEIFSYVNDVEIKYSRFNIMRKNVYNDQVIAHLENQYAAVFKEKYSFDNPKIEEQYPTSKFHRLKTIETTIKGFGKYKGKVFIFSDSRSFLISNIIAKTLKNNSNATVISDNNLEIIDDNYMAIFPQAILPNSNLVLTIQNSFVVDEEGKPIVKEYVKPAHILNLDKNMYEAQLRGEINSWYYDNVRKYTDKDEYYRKFLEIVNVME